VVRGRERGIAAKPDRYDPSGNSRTGAAGAVASTGPRRVHRAAAPAAPAGAAEGRTAGPDELSPNTRRPHMADRVLVTGGLGYLGSIVCEHLLDAGLRVTALDNLMYGAGQQGLFHLCANPAFDFIKGDVRDEALMRS